MECLKLSNAAVLTKNTDCGIEGQCYCLHMPRHIGSDGVPEGIPGFCGVCFAEQTDCTHPPWYYCKHRKRLAVQKEGG